MLPVDSGFVDLPVLTVLLLSVGRRLVQDPTSFDSVSTVERPFYFDQCGRRHASRHLTDDV